MLREVLFKGVQAMKIKEGERITGADVCTCFVRQLKYRSPEKHYGYALALTRVAKIGRAYPSGLPGIVYFPITFYARVYTPCSGDVMVGIVTSVKELGVMLECTPIKTLYLARRMMGEDYSFVEGDEPYFLGGDNTRIEKGTLVRLKVYAFRWNEDRRDFGFIVHIRNDSSLGPIQSAGDATDLESLCPDE